MPIDVKAGQFIVRRSKYANGSYSSRRADSVTAKQIRTNRGRGYDITERGQVVAAFDIEDKAKLVETALSEAMRQRENRDRESRKQFERDCEPAKDQHEGRVLASKERFKLDRAKILRAAGVAVEDESE